MTSPAPIVETFTEESIVLDLEVGSKRDVLDAMVRQLVACKTLPRTRKDQVLDTLVEREERGTTAFGKGIAMPHAKISGLKRTAGLLARCPEGLDFRAIDGEPVYVIIMLVSPESRSDEHLATLRWVSSMSRDPDFLSFIRQAQTAQDVMEVLQERAP